MYGDHCAPPPHLAAHAHYAAPAHGHVDVYPHHGHYAAPAAHVDVMQHQDYATPYGVVHQDVVSHHDAVYPAAYPAYHQHVRASPAPRRAVSPVRARSPARGQLKAEHKQEMAALKQRQRDEMAQVAGPKRSFMDKFLGNPQPQPRRRAASPVRVRSGSVPTRHVSRAPPAPVPAYVHHGGHHGSFNAEYPVHGHFAAPCAPPQVVHQDFHHAPPAAVHHDFGHGHHAYAAPAVVHQDFGHGHVDMYQGGACAPANFQVCAPQPAPAVCASGWSGQVAYDQVACEQPMQFAVADCYQSAGGFHPGVVDGGHHLSQPTVCQNY